MRFVPPKRRTVTGVRTDGASAGHELGFTILTDEGPLVVVAEDAAQRGRWLASLQEIADVAGTARSDEDVESLAEGAGCRTVEHIKLAENSQGLALSIAEALGRDTAAEPTVSDTTVRALAVAGCENWLDLMVLDAEQIAALPAAARSEFKTAILGVADDADEAAVHGAQCGPVVSTEAELVAALRTGARARLAPAASLTLSQGLVIGAAGVEGRHCVQQKAVRILGAGDATSTLALATRDRGHRKDPVIGVRDSHLVLEEVRLVGRGDPKDSVVWCGQGGRLELWGATVHSATGGRGLLVYGGGRATIEGGSAQGCAIAVACEDGGSVVELKDQHGNWGRHELAKGGRVVAPRRAAPHRAK